MELVNQSVCDNLLNPYPHHKFNQDVMICAGDVENGGRDTCPLGYYSTYLNFKKNQQIKRRD